MSSLRHHDPLEMDKATLALMYSVAETWTIGGCGLNLACVTEHMEAMTALDAMPAATLPGSERLRLLLHCCHASVSLT